jgi:hypothetical protein
MGRCSVAPLPATTSGRWVRKRRPVTLECVGNGRGVFGLPRTSGVQWQYGAVSTATWTGVRGRAPNLGAGGRALTLSGQTIPLRAPR